MKNIFYLPVKSIIVLLLVLFQLACQKADPEPPLADQLVGNYVATSYKVANATLNLPATSNAGLTITAKITCTKVSEEVANFTFILTQTKSGISTSSNIKLDLVNLKKATNGAIEGFKANTKEINWQDGVLMLIITDPDPNKVITVFAKKE